MDRRGVADGDIGVVRSTGSSNIGSRVRLSGDIVGFVGLRMRASPRTQMASAKAMPLSFPVRTMVPRPVLSVLGLGSIPAQGCGHFCDGPHQITASEVNNWL